MADFTFLNEVAARIKKNREQLAQVEKELKYVNTRIHEIPLRSETEREFARMIGMEYDDEREELEATKEKLDLQRESLTESINNDMNTFISEITSPDLVIPLDPKPEFSDGNTKYKYRDGTKFNDLFDILSELLGLSAPLVVKDVMLSASEIVVKVNDAFEAKKKFINSIHEIQKTLSIKKKQENPSFF